MKMDSGSVTATPSPPGASSPQDDITTQTTDIRSNSEHSSNNAQDNQDVNDLPWGYETHDGDKETDVLTKSSDPKFDGLGWLKHLFETEPRWTRVPKMSEIKETLSARGLSVRDVRFLAEGSFNKVYEVDTDSGTFIMRISLPVDPGHKTASEVATLEWVKQHTHLKVPSILKLDATNNNPIGFEWLLMTKIEGKPLADLWETASWSAKEKVTLQLAAFVATCFRNQLKGIGNIYNHEIGDPAHPGQVGRIVNMHFFWEDHIHQDALRGPFRTSHDWIMARLALVEQDQLKIQKECAEKEELDEDEEEQLELAARRLKAINLLKQMVPCLLPHDSDGEDMEPTMIFHADVNGGNILVDDNCELAAVIDWECVSAVPLWYGCKFPDFLDGKERLEEPDISKYPIQEDGERNQRYGEMLFEYEQTKLRKLFLSAMEAFEPKWVEVHQASKNLRDLDSAVGCCDDDYWVGYVYAWAQDIFAAGGADGVTGLWERYEDE